jgi:CheY-like chemotaxis protein
LLTLMRQVGFTQDEFAKLSEAKANSDALTRTKYGAMRLVESASPPSAASRGKAIHLLHDDAYHEAKANIMKPIGEFYAMTDRRTLEAVHAAEAKAVQVRVAIVLLGVLLIFIALSMRWRQLVLLGGSLGEVYAAISGLGGKNPSLAIRVARGREDSVLGWLAETQAKLARLDAERSQAEREQHKLNRALRLLSDCNFALVSARDEQTLLDEVCRLIVENGGYLMVWIGLAEGDAAKTVRPVARFGHGADEYLAGIRISWDTTRDIGGGPTGMAIGTGVTQINQDYLRNPKMFPWRDAAQRQGYQSSIAMPLCVGAQTIGALTLYAGEPDAFNAEEVGLLEELALRHASEPKLQDQLGKIAQASQHLLQVINDILDISKIEAERLTLERTQFKLGLVLENLVSLIGHKASEKGLKLLIDIPPEIAGRSFVGDPLRLGQILLNLAGNAVKFTDAGTISLCIRADAETPADSLLRFVVRDTGIGIAAADQERLFTAFEQADGSMTRKFGGTGLGLAISKRLAAIMGGEIGVESQPGVGSSFWFTARLENAADTVAPAPTSCQETAEAQLKSRFAGARILLAEDEPTNQEVARGLLEDAGLVVELAEDGEQAVAMARQTGYDLILMDMQMPRLNGVDATRAIRAQAGIAQPPILAMTANAFEEDRQVCLAAGMDDHIGKPVVPNLLYATLLKWLTRSRA